MFFFRWVEEGGPLFLIPHFAEICHSASADLQWSAESAKIEEQFFIRHKVKKINMSKVGTCTRIVSNAYTINTLIVKKYNWQIGRYATFHRALVALRESIYCFPSKMLVFPHTCDTNKKNFDKMKQIMYRVFQYHNVTIVIHKMWNSPLLNKLTQKTLKKNLTQFSINNEKNLAKNSKM